MSHWVVEIAVRGIAPLHDRIVTAIHLPTPTRVAVDTPAPQAFRPEEIAAWVDSALLESVR